MSAKVHWLRQTAGKRRDGVWVGVSTSQSNPHVILCLQYDLKLGHYDPASIWEHVNVQDS